MLTLFLCGEFLLHNPCWLPFYLGSFSYTSHAGFIFMWRVSLTHPVLALILSANFLLHIPCWLHFYLGSFSYTSRAGFIFMQGVSSTHPMPTVFMWGVSLTHPVLPSFLCGEFLLHIPCWLLDVGNFSYMFPGGWWLLYVRIFSYTSHGCAHHTNCLSKQNKETNKMISLSVGVSSLKKKNNK